MSEAAAPHVGVGWAAMRAMRLVGHTLGPGDSASGQAYATICVLWILSALAVRKCAARTVAHRKTKSSKVRDRMPLSRARGAVLEAHKASSSWSALAHLQIAKQIHTFVLRPKLSPDLPLNERILCLMSHPATLHVSNYLRRAVGVRHRSHRGTTHRHHKENKESGHCGPLRDLPAGCGIDRATLLDTLMCTCSCPAALS